MFDLAVTACFAPVAWWLAGLVVQGAQPRSARLSFRRPLLGRWSSSSFKRLRALAAHGPHSVLPRTAAPLSSPHVPGCAARSEHVGLAVASPALLGVVSAAPDSDAFTGGLQIVFTAAFAVIVGLIGLSIVRRILGS